MLPFVGRPPVFVGRPSSICWSFSTNRSSLPLLQPTNLWFPSTMQAFIRVCPRIHFGDLAPRPLSEFYKTSLGPRHKQPQRLEVKISKPVCQMFRGGGGGGPLKYLIGKSISSRARDRFLRTKIETKFEEICFGKHSRKRKEQ